MYQLLNWLIGSRPTRSASAHARRSRPPRPAGKRPARFALHLEALEDRLCPSITINAQALTISSVEVETIKQFATTQVQSLNLSAGSYTLADAENPVASITFGVDANGVVSYDSSESSVLSGTGTNTLTVIGCPISINAKALSIGAVGIDYNTPDLATATTINATVLPGTGLFLYDAVNTSAQVTFDVAPNSTISYPASENSLLSGSGTSSLTVLGCPISINAKALSIGAVGIDYNTPNLATATTINATVLPGMGLVLYDAVNTSAQVTFDVAPNSTITYPASENSLLSGSGTSTLTVLGCPISINAKALSIDAVAIDYNTPELATAKVINATVLPGTGLFLYDPGTPSAKVTFIVGPNSTITYPASENSVLSGSGTSMLTVLGCPISINAKALSIGAVGIDYNTPNLATATTINATVLPGMGLFLYDAVDTSAKVTFNVSPNSKITYSSTENSVLSGSGTSTLTVLGCPISINATALSIGAVGIDYNSPLYPTSQTINATVLPGKSLLLYDAGDTSAYVTFQVAPNSKVTFPSSENKVLATGSTPSTLIVNGCKVNFNATALSVPVVVVNSELTFNTASSYSATLLPGTESLSTFDGYSHIFFSVLDNDTVSYSSTFQSAGILGGQNTNTLTVYGEKISIDATALYSQGVTSFTIAGVGTFSTQTVQTLVLLPGWQSFSDSNGLQFNFLAEVVDPVTGNYDVVNYDPSLDGILSGEGTNTLVVR
jgi:hypothetical protein